MAEQTQLHSSWTSYIRHLKHSTQAFYIRVERAVREREVDGITFSRVVHAEGGVFSARREYLRVKRGDLYFDICGAPFGDGFFVSSRLISEGKFFDAMLFKGGSIAKGLFKPDTFYKQDTTIMYNTLVHDALMQAIDEITNEDSLPPLPEADRRPVMSAFYRS